MEIISEEEVEKLKAECKCKKVKEIHETTIFNEKETIQTIEIIRENSKPIVTEINVTPDDMTIIFNEKGEKE